MVRSAMKASMSTGVRKGARIPLGGVYHVDIVPILSDNFTYLLSDGKNAISVDPASPEEVISALESSDLTLSAVLTTHHHWDHSGGNEEIAGKYPGIPIFAYAPDASRIPASNVLMSDGESRTLPGIDGLTVTALHTPCHTTGHVSYLVKGSERACVFTGDTLFVGGCGKFFEGDGSMMEKSLNKTLAALDDETLVFCGHEYTVSNLRFAQSIEPNNDALNAKMEWSKKRVELGEPTVPTTIGDEKLYNPFMRTAVSSVKDAVNLKEGKTEIVMAALRSAKDNFRAS